MVLSLVATILSTMREIRGPCEVRIMRRLNTGACPCGIMQ
jgi:hypothetical protein